MRARLVVCALLSVASVRGQGDILTEDVTRFWEAFDALAGAKDHADSVGIIRERYLEAGSEGLQRFRKVRDLDPERYVEAIAAAPAFWRSVRANTLNAGAHAEAIRHVLDRYEEQVPGFKRPKVCFAIGRLSTGGTVSRGWILIGAEIVCADSTTDVHELNAWLRAVLRPTSQELAFVAHEAVHTRQRKGPRLVWGYLTHRLLLMSHLEGTADLVAREVAGITINEAVHAYGRAHEAELWAEFREQMHGNDISGWLYQGPRSTDRPADLGYFMGERIAARYYASEPDKRRALRVLLRGGAARKVLRKGGYAGP